MNDPGGDYSALIHAAAIVAASRDADDDVRSAANAFLLTEFQAVSANSPLDDPSQTDTGMEDDEPPERSEYIPRAGDQT